VTQRGGVVVAGGDQLADALGVVWRFEVGETTGFGDSFEEAIEAATVAATD
jgi:hypothetical protein